MIRLYSIVAAALVAGMLGVLGYMVMVGRTGDDQFAQCRATAISGGAGSIGGPFELVDHTGRTVTDNDLITQPTLLYFGYTFCPDVCPLDAERNALAMELLEDQGHIAQTAFISVDPRRDTPEVLAEFSSVFHDRMIGLTGSEAQIRAAAQAYRAYFSVPQAPADEFYLVDHSTFSYLVLPEHGFVEVIRRDQSAADVARQMACFIERS